MSDRRPDGGRDRSPAVALEDDALGRRLLPPLADRAGPAPRRVQSATDALARSAVATVLAIQEKMAREAGRAEVIEEAQEIEESQEIEELEHPRFRSRSWSGRRALALVAASLALLSFGALAAVVSRVVLQSQSAPASAFTTGPQFLPAPLPAPLPPVRAERQPALQAAPKPERRLAKVRTTRHRRVRPNREALMVTGPERDEVDLTSAPVEDLFALANQLRKARDWRGADEVYGAVTGRFPGSDAAVVAEIASATLHLEPLNDARGALAGYLRALAARPSGALAEDARWGIAEAHRALGDRPHELRALRDFIDRYPTAGLAPAARRRVAELAP